MRNLVYLSALSLVCLSDVWAKPVVRSSVKAEVRDMIPGARPLTPGRINYPEPGKLSVRGELYCGDGDVAHYASHNPQWDHTKTGPLKFSVGYWILPPTPNLKDSVPTQHNYVALGVGDIVVDGPYTSKYEPTTRGTYPASGEEILPHATAAVKRLVDSGRYSYKMPAMGSGSNQVYLYFGVTMCMPTNPYLAPPTPAKPLDNTKVALQMGNFVDVVISGATSNVKNATNWADAIDRSKVEVKDSGDSVSTTWNSTTGVAVAGSSPLVQLAKKIYDLPEPTIPASATSPADRLAAYKSALNSSAGAAKGDVQDIINDLASKLTCKDVSVVGGPAKYAWEPFPMQLACKALNVGTTDGLKGRLDGLFEPSAIPASATDYATFFREQRNALAGALLGGAVMKKALDTWADQDLGKADAIPRQRCFDTAIADRYIFKVMQSAVIPVADSTNEYSPRSSHPEGNYAIGGYDAYYDHDEHTIFGMTAASMAHRLTITPGSPTGAALDYFPNTIRLDFNVRGVGCGKNVYCYNDR